MLINWDLILSHVTPTGVIHVGAYLAEERKVYGDLKVRWVEADPDLIDDLRDKGLDVHHFAATSYNGTAQLNLMPFKPANSLLQPNLNAKRRSDVRVIDVVTVPARRLETIQEQGFNFIAMDIQGGELDALKGVDFEYVDALLLEVHEVDTYVNTPHISEIDYYLEQRGYERVITKMLKQGWGDALYTKIEI